MTPAEFAGHVDAINPTGRRWLALDPGPLRTGWVIYCPHSERVLAAGWEENERVLERLDAMGIYDLVVMEAFAAQGMALGSSSLETLRWEGRYIERARCRLERITRREIKVVVCGSARAKDQNIRAALVDLYAPGCEGRPRGTKGKPTPLTPLYSSTGASAHTFAALAVAHAWLTDRWGGEMSDRCLVCGSQRATQEMYDSHASGCDCPECEAVCWREFGQLCEPVSAERLRAEIDRLTRERDTACHILAAINAWCHDGATTGARREVLGILTGEVSDE